MSTKYTKEVLQEAVDKSTSIAGVLRYLNLKQAGGTQSYIGQLIKKFEIDTRHFKMQGWNKGLVSPKRKSANEILIVLPEGSFRQKVHLLRRAMIESGIPMLCASPDCPNPSPMWKGRPLTLEVDHIDGNWLNNLIDNLRFICPNCHSQEETTNRSWKNK